jgi:hypothetical protein
MEATHGIIGPRTRHRGYLETSARGVALPWQASYAKLVSSSTIRP